MIRFEILLPLLYNDGTPIEPEKFLATDDELLHHFGATSTDSIVVHGRWVYQSTAYSDKLIRIRMEVEDSANNWDAIRQIKETLKERFQQIDIWITAHRIDIV